MYYSQLSEVTNTAYMIRAGRQDELVKNAEASIAQCVVVADATWGDSEQRLGSFWFVQRYYEKFNLEVPADVKPILAKLPPRPLTSCQLKRPQTLESIPIPTKSDDSTPEK